MRYELVAVGSAIATSSNFLPHRVLSAFCAVFYLYFFERKLPRDVSIYVENGLKPFSTKKGGGS